MSAAFPRRPIDTASPDATAFSAQAAASSTEAVSRSRYRVVRRRLIRPGSISTQTATPPFIVTARGCAPPMPPSPAVRTMRPFKEPAKRCAASSPSVS